MSWPVLPRMIRRAFLLVVFALSAGFAVFWVLTSPNTEDAAAYAGIDADLDQGALVFYASGCSSCHSAPKASGAALLVLSGGREFPSPFGTFYAPNISSDVIAGIGDWSVVDLANALLHGTSPEGLHYFPAFPYTSYRVMLPSDVVSLRAYLNTLPASAAANRAHDVGFPFNIRRSLGGWKLFFNRKEWVVAELPNAEAERGRYLVEGLGHCGECHTARNFLGGLKRGRWLGGAPNPVGKGKIPNITPGGLNWNEDDILFFLQTGLTPDFDSAGGNMVDVIANLTKLPEADLRAIIAYLKAVPAVR